MTLINSAIPDLSAFPDIPSTSSMIIHIFLGGAGPTGVEEKGEETGEKNPPMDLLPAIPAKNPCNKINTSNKEREKRKEKGGLIPPNASCFFGH